MTGSEMVVVLQTCLRQRTDLSAHHPDNFGEKPVSLHAYPVNLEGIASAGGERRVPLPQDLLRPHARTKPELGYDAPKGLVDRNGVHLDGRKIRGHRSGRSNKAIRGLVAKNIIICPVLLSCGKKKDKAYMLTREGVFYPGRGKWRSHERHRH